MRPSKTLLQGSADGGESLVGQTFSVQGWVRTVRNQKKFAFLEVSCKCTVPHLLGHWELLTFHPGPLKQGESFRLAFEGACWVCSCHRMSLSARPALMLQLGDSSTLVYLTAFLLWS